MADVGPQPLPAPWPQTRPRRTKPKPRTTYRRSPGTASKPVPRTVPGAPGRVARLLGLARFIPFRGFVDLFFGGVLSNAERAAASQQSGIDYLTERQWSKLARGTERRVTVSRSRASPATAPAEIRLPGRATPDRVARALPNPLTLPEPVLQKVGNLNASLPEFSPASGIFSEVGGVSKGGAPPRASTLLSPKLLELPQFFPNFFGNLGSSSNPLLTPFRAPGVSSSPLASPLSMAEPLPQSEPSRCRCRAPKRKAGKPGKGFFTIDAKGREKRRYWQNREARSHARNAG